MLTRRACLKALLAGAVGMAAPVSIASAPARARIVASMQGSDYEMYMVWQMQMLVAQPSQCVILTDIAEGDLEPRVVASARGPGIEIEIVDAGWTFSVDASWYA